MLSKLLFAGVAVIGLLLAGVQKGSADQLFYCKNPAATNQALILYAASPTCPPGTTVTSINVAGPPGPQGPAGPAGPIGPSDVFVGKGGTSGNLNNTQPTVVVSLTVPPGNYFMSAIVPVVNTDSSDQFGECALNPGTTTPPGVPSYNRVGLNIVGFPSLFSFRHIALIGTTTFLVVGTITVTCTGFKWVAQNPGIIAIKVGAVHQ
jgi:hypothetical protein